MPAPHKTWGPSGKKSSSKPPTELSSAQILAHPIGTHRPVIPNWALVASFSALLGRDNRKIPPDRATRLPEHLDYMVAYIDEIEENGITIPLDVKEKLVSSSVRLALTARPRRHSSDAFKMHCTMVDLFLDKMKWPANDLTDFAGYKNSLVQHLPKLFSELSLHHGCGPRCPALSPTELEIKKKFWLLRNKARLRDTIVSFHHGIEPDSLRGPRHHPRTRRQSLLN